MSRREAMDILMNERGHNLYGAEAIVDYLVEDGTLKEMTKKRLIDISINYFED